MLVGDVRRRVRDQRRLAQVLPRRVAARVRAVRLAERGQRLAPFDVADRQVQGLLGAPLRPGEHEPAARVDRRLHQPGPRGRAQLHVDLAAGLATELDGGGVVVREQVGELAGPVARRALEPVCDDGMRRAPLAPGDAVVRDVAGEDVLEDVLGLTGERRAEPGLHEVALLQPGQLGGRGDPVAGQQVHGLGPEDPSDHRRGLQHPLVGGVEQVDARGQHPLDAVRDLHAVHVRQGAPAPVVADDQALVDEPAQDLLDEEGVPLGAPEDPGVHRRRQVVDVEEKAYERVGLGVVQPVERDRDGVAPAAAPGRSAPPPGPGATCTR